MKEGGLSVNNLHGLPFTIQNLSRRAENRDGHPALDKECGTAVGKIPLPTLISIVRRNRVDFVSLRTAHGVSIYFTDG